MKARFLIIPILILAACQPVDIEQPDNSGTSTSSPAGSAYTLTVTAIKSIDTKALELSGSTLNAYWVNGEKAGVYVNGLRCGQLVAQITGEKSTTATLSGTVNSSVTEGATIMLLYPDREDITEGTKWDYTGQTGVAPSLSSDIGTRFDYATATLTVSGVDNENHRFTTTTSSVTFQNEQSIYRFGFKVGGSGDPIAVKSFVLSSNRSQLVRSRSWSGSDWTSECGTLTVTSASAPDGNLYYLSLRNENTTQDDTYSFSIVGGDDALYFGNKVVGSTHLGQGKFISAQSVSVSKADFSPVEGKVQSPGNVL